jgi:phosphonate transport system substrate-binding protein
VDTAKVKVFYTTPGYFDYNWTVHADMPAAQREKLTQAFLNLDASTPEGKEILALQRATRFIATQARELPGHRTGRPQCGAAEVSRGDICKQNAIFDSCLRTSSVRKALFGI